MPDNRNLVIRVAQEISSSFEVLLEEAGRNVFEAHDAVALCHRASRGQVILPIQDRLLQVVEGGLLGMAGRAVPLAQVPVAEKPWSHNCLNASREPLVLLDMTIDGVNPSV